MTSEPFTEAFARAGPGASFGRVNTGHKVRARVNGLSNSPHTDRFAAYLRMLKDRSGRGFDKLGKQAGVSGSSLHRYCSGASVPADYRVVHAFAKVCGADVEELRELHQLWALADVSRDDPGPAATPPDQVLLDQAPPEQESPAEESAAHSDSGEEDGEDLGFRRFAGRHGGTALLRRSRVLVMFAVVVLLGGVVWVMTGHGVPFAGASGTDNAERLLFSPACPASVSMGEHDECVREVQNLLSQAKAKISVDGEFGPQTLRRVTAFQVLAGIQPRGIVDEPTKTALYDRKVSMETWSTADVEKRIRAVFPEVADTAVAIARCQSFLDPLWVLPNTNGSRNWGVFQISDDRLLELGGNPLRAYDPAWNIDAAHRLWSVRHDFHDWPNCEAALVRPAP